MTPSTTSPSQVRLGIPRHLQDCNGYCGPACVMMVHSSCSNEVESQDQIFRRVRDHARKANDRRPVKSPAESLLALLNTRGGTWEKLFRAEPEPVAARIVQAVEQEGQPCLLLISKGMHWVVAFGRTLRDDGNVAGVLTRDPAWAGMPKFFGLTTMPEQPTFRHTAADPCPCLASNNPPGSVHERYMALEELLSQRGLQGSPDWEGKGALALVPVLSKSAAAAVLAVSASTDRSDLSNPSNQADRSTAVRTAALHEPRAHGLHARPDWKQVLDGGQPGEPILVKDPADSRDDFYLVPVHSSDAALRRTAWIMLDPSTLRLREASLLNDWTAPAFPTDEEAKKIENHDVTLPDGTRHRFQRNKLKPNQRNLVWQASAASILPYWPVKEFTAPHPVTGEQVSIYMTQHGDVCSLSPHDTQPDTRPVNSAPPPRTMPRGLLVLYAAAGVAAALGIAALRPTPTPCQNFNSGSLGGWKDNLPDDPKRGAALNLRNDANSPTGVATDGYMLFSDQSGVSWIQNEVDFSGDWTRHFDRFLSFDFRLLEDGRSNVRANPNPVRFSLGIYSGGNGGPFNGTIRAVFVMSRPVTDTMPWKRFYFPIGPLVGNVLPSNTEGTWVMQNGAPNSDWNTLMANVKGIYFSADVTPGSEVIALDNICITKSGEIKILNGGQQTPIPSDQVKQLRDDDPHKKPETGGLRAISRIPNALPKPGEQKPLAPAGPKPAEPSETDPSKKSNDPTNR